MGETDRYIEFRNRKLLFGSDRNALVILVCINLTMFLILAFIRAIYIITKAPQGTFETEFAVWFIMPASLSSLAQLPWTVISYMFTHQGFIGFLTNMLWLWAFGSILQSLYGNRKIIPIYLYGGIAGAVTFIAASNLIPALKPFVNTSFLAGGNAAIMAVAIATTALAPDYRFFRNLSGGIPLWVLTAIFVLIDFVGFSTRSAAFHFSHIAGGLIGFLFVVSLKRGYDWSLWMNNAYSWFMNLFNPERNKLPQKKIREKVFYSTGGQQPYIKTSNVTQKRVDDILDKINQKGYQLLTDEEKNILKRAGKDL